MTDAELNLCRVVLAAFRQLPHTGRIEVQKHYDDRPPTVRIVRSEVVTVSATIPIVLPSS